MADMNELRRLLEQGVISEQDVADAMQQQPRNELAQMMTHGPGMPQPRFDIAPMEMNTMRAENGPNAGQVTPMNFTGGMPQQPQQKLGDRVEVVGRGMGRYSQDGRSVVFADGSTHDLHPQASAMAAKAAFERMKAEAALANQNAGTAKTLEEITSLRNSRSEKARERTEMGAAPQSFLEKKYGKPASGMRWTQEGEPEPIPGMAEPQKVTDAKDVLEILKIAEPLLEKSTGSYGGAALDKLGQVVGISTEGANAAAQLKTLQGTLISKMPKMTGPFARSTNAMLEARPSPPNPRQRRSSPCPPRSPTRASACRRRTALSTNPMASVGCGSNGLQTAGRRSADGFQAAG
jgi:hypothetical protein